MRLKPPRPRLLPATMLAMAALLASKSISLVRAAVPHGAAAQATAAKPASREPDAAANPEPAPPTSASDPAARLEPPVSQSERSLLLDLRQRRAELDAREAAMLGREQMLAAAEHRLSTRIEELTDLRSRLEALETARKARDDANWRGMVKVYESMKPRDAATIFNDLDAPVLLQILDRMKDSKAAPVLAAMQPDRARRATVDLAEMRAKANTTSGSASPDKNADVTPKPTSAGG